MKNEIFKKKCGFSLLGYGNTSNRKEMNCLYSSYLGFKFRKIKKMFIKDLYNEDDFQFQFLLFYQAFAIIKKKTLTQRERVHFQLFFVYLQTCNLKKLVLNEKSNRKVFFIGLFCLFTVVI